jgi:hypothetical protein
MEGRNRDMHDIHIIDAITAFFPRLDNDLHIATIIDQTHGWKVKLILESRITTEYLYKST